MNNSIIAYNPCGKCEKDKCNICELNLYRQGTLKKDKWISVEDRLPNPLEDVLVFDKYREVTIGFTITSDGSDWKDQKITHWMLLPQPPKMKGAD